MDHKKTSEDHPEGIRNLSDPPSDNGEEFLLVTLSQVQFANSVVAAGPAFYLARLKRMISLGNNETMSLVEFLQKDRVSDPVSDLVSQRQTQIDWLRELNAVDFKDPASILNIRLDLVKYNVGKFVLSTDSKSIFTVTPDPGAMSVEYMAILKDADVHPGLLSLEFVDKPDNLPGETAKSPGVDQPLPSLVLPIGQLLKEYTTENDVTKSDETNYIVVVDAVASAHPVWLIFDRMLVSESDQDDEYYSDNKDDEKKEGIHPDTVDLVFNGTEKNFDAAQVLPSIQDWFQLYDKLSFTQIRDSFRKTGLTGKVKAREVTAEDVSVLWNKDTSVDKNN
ncbi:hypothetical protein FPANT_9815 [Fusarium pseudoanthophilum]|uniref:Uncharacterized protein n=1 Tax=Fusarium pseudoanthophilum TaxID=48495 RepID=A0A8H5NUN2_9HYPO|nr:hypothetical protein FPANT_9815 [Fusarium pseudoanthophilum]